MNDIDHFKTLKLESNASIDDVRRSFRRLALKYHPDKNKDPDADEKFREIVEAYESLSNEPSRAVREIFDVNICNNF